MKLITRISTFYMIPAVLLLAIITRPDASSYDHYLLSCGSDVVHSNSTLDGRTWDLDSNSTFSKNFSSTIPASIKPSPNIDNTPFSTARIFTSNFTYSFPVSPGPKFIRLYFYPSPSPYLSSSSPSTIPVSSSDSYLTVEANSDHLLLRNFSALAYLSSNSYYVVKEFYLNVTGSHLQLTFFPTPPNSHAFVNGIEVVSIPDNLYIRPNSPEDSVRLDTSTALETVYRLNVGGSQISPLGDVGSMHRQWENDDQYLGIFPGLTGIDNNSTMIKYSKNTPSYSAPVAVYHTFRSLGAYNNDLKSRMNLTWSFEVDLGFSYLVRLHWCEIVVDVSAKGYRVFDVYMDNQVEEDAVDIFAWVGSNTAVFKDYIVFMCIGDGSTSRGLLQLALYPNITTMPQYLDVLLNGLEIFKINRIDGSLDASNPRRISADTTKVDHTPYPSSSHSHILPAAIGIISGVFILNIFLCYIFIIKRIEWSKMSVGTTSNKLKRLIGFGKSGTNKRSDEESSSLPSDQHCRYFSPEEVRLATSDFSKSNIIGHGGFGYVYKGTIETESGPTIVAIKRRNPLSKQGPHEYKMEIELLSKLHHVNLVSLIGYCHAAGEMILVYEYMPHGTLRDHIFLHNLDPNMRLSWHSRLEICLGAARGLHFLHTHTDGMIIHRDVKSANILLDETWVAKISDLGYSKFGPTEDNLGSHVSTAVKGSFGYVDPEYYRSRQLTEKSDVYSFGMVLFEVLCGRAAMNLDLPKEQVNLRIWARKNLVNGTLDTIVDPTLKGQIAPECLRKFGELAESCVRDKGINRPSMADVICGLQFALQLQPEASTPKLLSLYKRPWQM